MCIGSGFRFVAHILTNPHGHQRAPFLRYCKREFLTILDSCQVDLFYRLALSLYHGKTWVSAHFPVVRSLFKLYLLCWSIDLMDLLTRRDCWKWLHPFDFITGKVLATLLPIDNLVTTAHFWQGKERGTHGPSPIAKLWVSLKSAAQPSGLLGTGQHALKSLVAASEFERRRSAECLGPCS